MGKVYLQMDFLLRVIRDKNGLHNIISLFRKSGRLKCPNGYALVFSPANAEDVKRLFVFCMKYGVKFSDEEGFWHYKNGIVTTPQGIRFYVDWFDPLIFAETFLYDVHFSDFHLENKTVIQAGGFIGDTALYYAYRGARVYSFEPDPNLFNLALKNIKLNPELSDKITMKNYAIGKDEIIEFPLNPHGEGGSSAYSLAGKKTVRVRSVSIKTILEEFSIHDPFLLDLDIKGKEFEVINDEAISRFKMVRIEYTTSINGKKIGDRQELINKLKEYGFNKIRIFKHNESPFDLVDHGTIEAVRDF
jgi:FkbM family methyltransferase